MSRWVSLPDHATDVEGGLPQGFRAAGVACGLKPSGGADMGLLVSDSVGTVSAARFTRSGVLAAPVILCQERCRLDSLRAVVANAGNANAATGRRGVDNAARMQGAAAMAVGLDPEVVAVASTGVIGVQLPDRPITQGILAARGELSENGDEAFGEAIRTTDLFPKRACVDVDAAERHRPHQRAGQGRGDDLAQLRDDAVLRPDRRGARAGDRRPAARRVREALVRPHLGRRPALHQRHGDPDGERRQRGADRARVRRRAAFGEALDAILRRLALLIVRDGEGAKRVGRVVVNGGHEETVNAAARAVANSPLVKAALHGGDPNWGRIAQAVGGVLLDTAPLDVNVWIEDVQVCSHGAAVPFDLPALQEAVAREEVEYTVGLPGEGVETEVFFSDLSHDYVSINAEYTT